MSTDIHTWLNERETIRSEGDAYERFNDAYWTIPKLLRGVKKVLELHKPVENKYEERPVCDYCHDDAGPHVLYPCPTIEALQEAVNDDE